MRPTKKDIKIWYDAVAANQPDEIEIRGSGREPVRYVRAALRSDSPVRDRAERKVWDARHPASDPVRGGSFVWTNDDDSEVTDPSGVIYRKKSLPPEDALPVVVDEEGSVWVADEPFGGFTHNAVTVEPGPYVLLPRPQVEGDDNPNENGG